MGDYDYLEETQSQGNISAIIFNALSVVFLIGALCLAGYFLQIFINPQSSLNLFPPPTLPAVLEFPTITPTPREVLPPTWTPGPTASPTPTSTPRPTATLPASPTPFSILSPTSTLTESQTTSGTPFVVSQGSPTAISSVTFHPEEGCNWMSVAGQVLDMSGAPISTGVIIQLGGVLQGQYIEKTSLTGVAPQYGQAGYEIFLADEPVATTRTLWVQLLDQAGLPLSQKVYFDTYSDCEKNLIFVNFKQVR
jgi:hypothetical protein